ncbi:von Willebrand factor type A domain protein, partial [mine drainage metagenome]
MGAGAVTLWVWVNGTSGTTALATYANLGVTVFPRTLLIDETGVAPGVNGSQDTFTYVATDFNSADIPFNTTTIPPGSSIVTWLGSGPDALDNYDVIVWVLSNSNGYLSPSDAAALQLAVTQGDRSVWLLGANALAGSSSAVTTLQPYFGVLESHLNTQTFTSPVNLAVSQTTPISATNVNNGNLYLSPVLDGYVSHTTYRSIVPVSTSNIFIQEGSSPNQLPVATYNVTVTGGKAMASPFELATVSQEMPNGTTQYVTSLGQQSALVYGIFNWLSNFSSLTPVRQASDWAVSQVTVQPTNIAYNTPIYVNYTVRNNGPSRHAIPVALYVNGAEAYVAGSPVTNTLSPTTLGGVSNGTFIWTPTFVGFLTVTVVINPPPSDADLSNNQMGNSLFAEQLYVHYNVLLVDATLGSAQDTTPLVYHALNATGFPAGTVTEVRLTSACAALPSTVSLSLYNLVIWNAGNKNNASGDGPCVLTPFDVTELSSYLDDGGKAASLLFIGGGLLTETNTTVVAFAEDFLGAIVPASPVLPTAPSGVLYGANGDPVGDGLAIPYAPVGTGNNFTYHAVSTVNLNAQPSLYYDQKDYWTLNNPPDIAASDGYSVSGGWTTSFWAFNLATAGDSPQVELLMLRASTFFGRVLPQPDVVVSPPETTFATSISPWQNFAQLHPQINEQNLIRINVTNLGGTAAFSVGVDVLDGSHILEATSVTVGRPNWKREPEWSEESDSCRFRG